MRHRFHQRADTSNLSFYLENSRRAADAYLNRYFEVENGPRKDDSISETHYTDGRVFIHYLVGRTPHKKELRGFTISLASSDKEALEKTRVGISDEVDSTIFGCE